MWILSVMWGIPFAFINLDLHIEVILYYSYVMQAILLLVSSIAYVLIGRSQQRRKSLFDPSILNDPKHKMGNLRKKRAFIVSFGLILTFFAFYIVPNYVKSTNKVTSTVMIALTYIGLIIDPIMYTLLNPALRNIAKNLFLCGRCRTWKRKHTTDTIGTVDSDFQRLTASRRTPVDDKSNSASRSRTCTMDIIEMEPKTRTATVESGETGLMMTRITEGVIKPTHSLRKTFSMSPSVSTSALTEEVTTSPLLDVVSTSPLLNVVLYNETTV